MVKPWDGWGKGQCGAEQGRGEELQRAELWGTIGQFWLKWGRGGHEAGED